MFKTKIYKIIFIIFVCKIQLAQSKDKQYERPQVDYCNTFILNIVGENKQSMTPETWEQASVILYKALPNAAKTDFIKNNGEFSACFPNVIFRKIKDQLKREWDLNRNNNSLINFFNRMGFWELDEIIRLVISRAWTIHSGEQFDEKKAMRQKFLSVQDDKMEDSIHTPCHINIKNRSKMSTTVINGYIRILRWEQCSNGIVINYLWERGWFKPTYKELQLFCKKPFDDQEKYCKRKISGTYMDASP